MLLFIYFSIKFPSFFSFPSTKLLDPPIDYFKKNCQFNWFFFPTQPGYRLKARGVVYINKINIYFSKIN